MVFDIKTQAIVTLTIQVLLNISPTVRIEIPQDIINFTYDIRIGGFA